MEEYFNVPYKQAKDLAHQFYRQIGSVNSSYFNNEPIYFTSDGFNHLIRKRRTPRPKSEQRRRFYLLHLVKGIIENPNLKVIYSIIKEERIVNRYGEKILELTDAEFWTLIYHPKVGHTIKVVIRRLKRSGTKHFFSVMANKAFFREILQKQKIP